MRAARRHSGALGRGISALLALSVLVVGLTAADAVAAATARARDSAPQFLFLWLLPNAVGGGRFLSLAATLALPALAVGLPGLALVAALAARRARGIGRSVRVAAVLLLALGLASGAALYCSLGAVPLSLSGRPAGTGGAEDVKPRPSDLPVPEGSPRGGEGEGEGEARPSPRGGEGPRPTAGKGAEKIVFASDRDGGWHLWMMNPDGSGQERLWRSDGPAMQPRLAPDGTRVVFTATRGEQHLVKLLDWSTRTEREVCRGDQASFTADGRGLVFRRGGAIWHRDLEAGAERQLSPAMWSRSSFPSASPDGRWVAFASRLMAGYDIFLVPFGAGEPRRLVSGRGSCDPRWSPTGRWLSYQTETHIFTVRPDGTNALQATFGGGVQHYAAWSPDEGRLAYCQGPGPEGPWQICIVSLTTDEEPIQLTGEGSNVYPDWGFLRK